MKDNHIRNNLLLLKQFGFTDKTLETLYLYEDDDIIDIIYDDNILLKNRYESIFNKREIELTNDLKNLYNFSNKFKEKMREYKNNGIKIYFKYDKDYPNYLFEDGEAPLFLYCLGNLKLLDESGKRVAIVGTRNPTPAGIESARNYVREYLQDGWITISGLASGIDTIVHEVTLDNQGKTIAVLPTSFEKIYPKENEQLFKLIVENNGLLITEIGPFENTYRSTFLNRNKIVANISKEILIIEAGIKSGTLNTVRNGHLFGRPIYYDEVLLSKEVIEYISKFNAKDYKLRGS